MPADRLIRDARRHRALAQRELAELSGTSQATLSAYESGTKIPSAATLERVLRAAGMRLVAVPATRPLRTPSRGELERRGRILAEVVDLAERLPARHDRRTAYPILRDRLR